MLLAVAVDTSRRVAESAKRREKVDLLAGLLRQLQAEEIEIVVAFLAGRTRQSKIGIGYGALRDARSAVADGPTLEVAEVDRTFQSIADTRGPGSERRRSELLRGLLARATVSEQQFVTALLLGELRQGALDAFMVEAVAKASGIAVERVRRAVMMAGDSGPVARAALEQGEAGLTQYDVRLFRPAQPMLAQTAEDVAEALSDLEDTALEFKLDGARVQVHRSGGEVVVYSRNLNDVTAAVPEIVESVLALPAKDLILDGEVLSLHPDGRPQPFQVTMRRFGRRLNVDALRAELPLTPFWFDLLYWNGSSLLDEPQRRRFAALAELAQDTVVPHAITSDVTQGSAFLDRALTQGHEGIMAKALGASYAAGARGRSWIKIKRPRTLDLVILAAEWGHGRRHG